MDNKIPELIVSSLKEYYNTSQAIVRNSEEESDLFKTTIGVKQGGPLSPLLFAMYVDDLIERVEKMNTGPRLGELILDIILYADDILLIASSKEELQKKIDIVSQYGREFEIKFNPDKTFYLEFGGKNKKQATFAQSNNEVIMMDKQTVKKVDQFKYLGVIITTNLRSDEHLLTRRKSTMIKKRFLLRLAKNPITNSILKHLIDEIKINKNRVHSKSLIKELNLTIDDETTLDEVMEDTRQEIKTKNLEFRNTIEDPSLQEIHSILRKYNYTTDVCKLNELLRSF